MALPRVLGRVTGNFFSQLFGYAIGGAVTSVLEPALNPLVIEAWRELPTSQLSVDLLANAVVQGHLTFAEAANEAKSWGYTEERFQVIVDVTGSPPGPQELLALWDRGAIDEARVRKGLLQSRLKPEWIDAYLKLQRNYLSPQEAAAMVVQGVVSDAEGKAIAAISSVTPDDFERLVRVNGLPPGVQTGLELWRRGKLTETDFETLVRQGHTKTEYIEALKALKEDVLSPATVAEMVVQSIIPEAEGARIAAISGVTAEDFGRMVLVRGRPPGPAQALDWLRRKIITQQEFATVIAESNVKTKYTGSYLEALERLPTLVQIRSMFKSGNITKARAEDLLAKHGFGPDIIAAYLASVTQAKGATQHELTVSQELALYESGLRTRAQASAALEAIGYDAADAGELLDLADARRINSARTAALRVVHADFVRGLYTEAEVAQALDGLKVDPRVRDDLLAAWDVERKAITKTLTEAQVASGVKKGLIPPLEGAQRIYNLGYSQEDARLLLSIQAGVDWTKVEGA